jgi:voltage-gated potassium channel Kch
MKSLVTHFSAKTRKRVEESSMSVLLGIQILTIFLVAPSIDGHGNHLRWIMDLCLALAALVSVFSVTNGVLQKIAILSFSLCVAGLAIGPQFTDTHHGPLVASLSGFVFCGNVIWIAALKVFDTNTSTLHRIRGAIIMYLNMSLLFALIESMVVAYVPGAYSGLPATPDNTIGTMIYFSMATLTTIGYGDIVPVHPVARSLATLEAMIGQFYMGTLIAALVGIHVSRRQQKHETSR